MRPLARTHKYSTKDERGQRDVRMNSSGAYERIRSIRALFVTSTDDKRNVYRLLHADGPDVCQRDGFTLGGTAEVVGEI